MQLLIDLLDQRRTMALSVTIRSDPEHQEIPCTCGHGFRGAIGDADRFTIVRGQPDAFAVTGKVLLEFVSNMSKPIRVELTALLDNAEDGCLVRLRRTAYQNILRMPVGMDALILVA